MDLLQGSDNNTVVEHSLHESCRPLKPFPGPDTPLGAAKYYTDTDRSQNTNSDVIFSMQTRSMQVWVREKFPDGILNLPQCWVCIVANATQPQITQDAT